MTGPGAGEGDGADPWAARAPGRGFPELPGGVDLPAIEQEILRRWRDGDVFGQSLAQTAGGPRWTVYEGPPTANGMPGVHHIEARVFKDLFGRFKTMQGCHVPRRAGWDCHGLPVEVAVERELGLAAKPDIEEYGIAEFNARCRESVLRHVAAFGEMTTRMGYWVDMSAAYQTMDPAYIESVWWSLKEIFAQGLLIRDYRISPYCPRCGTPLSDHELGQPEVYRLVTEPAVTVRLPLLTLPPTGGPRRPGRAGRGAGGPGAGRGLARRGPDPRRGPGRRDLPPAVRAGGDPGGPPRGHRVVRHGARRHGARSPGPGVRR